MFKGNSFSNVGVALLAVLLFACASFSQNITGTILGTVTDASGAAVSGASILIWIIRPLTPSIGLLAAEAIIRSRTCCQAHIQF